MRVLPYDLEFENSVMKLSHKAWLLFKYNRDYGHQKMSCVFDEEEELIAVGYLRHGIADDYDIMEMVMELNETASKRISEVRRSLYPSLIGICQTIRDPAKKTKVVAWEDFDGDQAFYIEQGFSPYQTYYFAKRLLDKSIFEVKIPVGVVVSHRPMESKEERMKYTEVENRYYQGVLYRSVNMLEWMMGGPELHTISAYEGDELVGSVMCWQTGAVERIFVVPPWRDKGLAEYLIAKAFEYHYGNGRTSVETLVNEMDGESKSLLTSMGYSFSVKLELLGLDME